MHTIFLAAADFQVNVFAELAKQGTLIGLLALIVWILYKKQGDNEKYMAARLSKCEIALNNANARLEQYMNVDRERVLAALSKVTEVCAELKEYMEKEKV